MGKIIILGKGFIGTYLADELSKSGYVVKGFSSGECNLLEPDSIKSRLFFLDADDVVIMTSSITRLVENSEVSMMKNINMTINISNQIAKSPVKQFIFLSTVDVYGLLAENQLITEKLPLYPDDYYSMSKVVSEFILKKKLQQLNIPLAILRLTGVYGPGDSRNSTIGKLYNSILEKNRITVYGDGKSERDYIYVGDICSIIKSIIGNPFNSTLNVATGKSYRIIDIAKLLIHLSAREADVEFKDAVGKAKRAENMNYDVSRLKNSIKDLKLTELKDGIRKYISAN